MDTTLIILAAGLGSRYGGLKQIEPVGKNGEIMADFSVYDAKKAGFNKVVFVIKKENEKDFCERVINRIAKNFNTDYVFQEIDDLPENYTTPPGRVKPWGTGHAVLSARGVVRENFAVINADDFYGYDTFKKLADFLSNSSEGRHCMVGFSLKNTVTEHGSVSRGICAVENGYLASITETTKIFAGKNEIFAETESGKRIILDQGTVVSMNAWGFNLSAMKIIENSFNKFIKTNIDSPNAEFYLPFAVDEIISVGGSVMVLNSEEKWYGVTYKEDRPLVAEAIGKMISGGVYPEKLWK